MIDRAGIRRRQVSPGRWLILLSGLATGGCTIFEPGKTLSILTDRGDYTLVDAEHTTQVVINVRITNHWGQDVYIHRQCGYGDHPARRVVRVSGDSSRVFISGSDEVCITGPMRGPMPVAQGATFDDSFVLRASKAFAGGRYRVAYDVQLQDKAGGWGPAEPVIPRERTISNTFAVRPPDG